MPSAVSCPCLNKTLHDPTCSQTFICSASAHPMPQWLGEEQSPSVLPYPVGTRDPELIHSPGSASQGCGDAAAVPQSCASRNIPSLLGSFWVRTSDIGASPLLSTYFVSPIHRDFHQRFPSCSPFIIKEGGGTFWGTVCLTGFKIPC